MKPLALDQSHTSSEEDLSAMCASRLRHHVSAIGHYDSNTKEFNLHAHPFALQQLSSCIPQLRHLVVSVSHYSGEMEFSANLTGLHLQLLGGGTDFEKAYSKYQFNSVLYAASRLERLQHFIVVIRHWGPECSMEHLARAQTLRRLQVWYSADNQVLKLTKAQVNELRALTNAQVNELRALPQLDFLFLACMDEPMMTRLLAQPHQLQWKEVEGFSHLTARMAELLCSLPLTTLDASLLAMPHADFLVRMPKLIELNLGSARTMPMDSARVFRTLGQCVQLQSLTLSGGGTDRTLCLSNEHLASCLPSLTSLHSLIIQTAAHLTTLSFLTLGNLPRTLTSLELSEFERRLPSIEVKHLLSLRKLSKLRLRDVFDKELSEEGLLLFQPPVQSSLMPDLAVFKCEWTDPNA